MSPESLLFWANIAAIYCVVNGVILSLVIGVAFGFAWWYLRKGRKALMMPLLMAQVYALRAQHITLKVTDAVANVPIGIHTTTTRLKVTAQTLLRGRSNV